MFTEHTVEQPFGCSSKFIEFYYSNCLFIDYSRGPHRIDLHLQIVFSQFESLKYLESIC